MNVLSSFSGASVNDLEKAKAFYSDLLGLELEDDKMGLQYKLPGGGALFLYPKEDHSPASYTMLNLVVSDIDVAVEELTGKGIKLERYDGMPQDEKGIMRGKAANMGPDIAWFTDPAGNIISVIQES